LGTVGKGATRRLMVGETVNRPGCWSSFPPHKHDEDRPREEVAMEEVFFSYHWTEELSLAGMV